jgi:putative endonuclease
LEAGDGMFWVYILENAVGRFYVGSTYNPDRRLDRHNSQLGAKTFTHKHGPWRIVWREPHPSRSSALAREKQIKSMKSAKWIRETLLHGGLPMNRD